MENNKKIYIHDDKFINKLIEELSHDPEVDISDIMKEYAEHIRQKTIDECISCVNSEIPDEEMKKIILQISPDHSIRYDTLKEIAINIKKLY